MLTGERRRKRTQALEPMRDFIQTCNSVGKAIKNDNRFELRQICQKAVSNFKLSNKKLAFSFLSPFDLIENHKKSVGKLLKPPKAAKKNFDDWVVNYLLDEQILPEWWPLLDEIRTFSTAILL